MIVPPLNSDHVTPVGPVMLPAESVPGRQGVMACMGRVSRDGKWVLPRLFRVVCVMGEVVLDLTNVQLGPGASDIEVLVIAGEIKITIPHNLHVECDDNSVLGEFKVRRATDAVPSPDAPTVCIRGTAFMGTVNVKVVDPSVAPNWRDQWRAARAAKRAAKHDAKVEARLERDRLRG